MSPGIGTYWFPPRWAHVIMGKMNSTGVQRFANAKQSVECSALTNAGGIYNEDESETMEGHGLEELAYSGCTVWTGKFSSELKECHVTSLEGSQETGKPGVVSFDTTDELVYLDQQGTKIGYLFAGSGKRLGEMDFSGTGCAATGKQDLVGEVLAEVTPLDKEVKSVKIAFPATAKMTCWKWTLPGTLVACATVKLSTYGVATTQSGEVTEELSSKESYGPYN